MPVSNTVLPHPVECPPTAMTASAAEVLIPLPRRERHATPSWYPLWNTRCGSLQLPAFGSKAAPVSLRALLDHSYRTAEPVPISRVVRRDARKLGSRSSWRLPRDLQAIAASMVLGAALWALWSTHAGGPADRAVARSESYGKPAGALAVVRQAIAKRASVEYDERFGPGADLWTAPDDGKSAAWTYAHASSDNKRMALYRPSLALTNYRLEFLAQINKRSAGWMVRATNPQNYYALDLRISKPGPRPMLSLIRYPVIEGRAGHKVEVPVPLRLQNNVPYRIAMAVKGHRFSASIEGQEIDSWSEDTLARGGVGFFNEAGANAKVYWVKVINNDDLLGRICGTIASALSGPSEVSLYRPAGYMPLSGPGFFFATATVMETPGSERSITNGIHQPRNRRG